MKKCCEETLNEVVKLIGEEIKKASNTLRSGLGSQRAVQGLYKVQRIIREYRECNPSRSATNTANVRGPIPHS